jgi:hypothetical protein
MGAENTGDHPDKLDGFLDAHLLNHRAGLSPLLRLNDGFDNIDHGSSRPDAAA